ncbi:hypothetical protein ACFC3F_07460 [Microbacterium sp. NPDC055910]|uniref:hypothetical protein n=1 Tax=Microbacterium sp. NPDC055910 TaxID=3345659 RepID=UPI0035E1709B
MWVTTACAADPDPDSAQSTDQGGTSQTSADEALDVITDAASGSDADGDDGRAFGSSDDAVIQAVEITFSSKNGTAEWVGSTLRVTMDGSVGDPTAKTPCLALEAIIAAGEDATVVYGDGEIICADRHNTD